VTPATASAQVGIGVGIRIGPPALPIYAQPPLPGPGYLWTPGYWAYGDAGYFWVPGTWAQPPQVGFLWTPGYWGWNAGLYGWNGGYWGPHVGFYGGINYGFGYGGVGFGGGYWNNGAFFYNRSVNNFGGVHITNVYNKTVINNVNINHTAFNGGPGGIAARPTPEEERFRSESHVPATAEQTQHEHLAAANPALRASVNHGSPPIAATSKPGDFSGHGVVPARAAGAPYKAPAGENAAKPGATANGSRMAGTTPRTPPPTHTNPSHPSEPTREGTTPRPGTTPHTPPPSHTNTAHPGEMSHNPPPAHQNAPAPHNPPHQTAPHNPPPHEMAPHNAPPPHETAPHNPPPHAAPEQKGGEKPKP
jgi:hypothetical protein